MNKYLKGVLRISVVGLSISSIILPTSALASEKEELEEIPAGTIVESPWEELDVSFTLDEELPSSDNKVVYEEAAQTIKDEILSGGENGERKSIIQLPTQTSENIKLQAAANLQQSNVIRPVKLNTKSWYRTQFNTLALAMGSYNAVTAGQHLKHSLQDKPADKDYGVGHKLSNGFSKTKVYTEISIPMAKEIDKAAKAGKTAVGAFDKSSATSISNSGLDWYLTIGKFSYDWMAEKVSSKKWKVYIGIHDTYNYEAVHPLPKDFPTNLITLVANHAANAQKAKAIVPYQIDIFMEQNYTPKK